MAERSCIDGKQLSLPCGQRMDQGKQKAAERKGAQT